MIVLQHVTKTFRSRGQIVHAVKNVTLEVRAGEVCVLIGPSGSGKTTTMRLINRLEVPTEGRIIVNGQDINSVDVVQLRRSIGYVIQQVGLFPHFTVADNVAVVLRLLRWPTALRRRRVEELLHLVGLPPSEYAHRYPRELSGGQQQRVGVARALAADPPIVLMDEPFGAVDPITRKQLQHELRRIQGAVRKTIVFVTHDVSEAFLLGDRIVLMRDGTIIQDGAPAELLRNPAHPFVSDFIGQDRAVLALQHTRLVELAKPRPPDRPQPGTMIPGTLSLLEALQRLAWERPSDREGIWVSDSQGNPVGYVGYTDLVQALGRAVTPDASVEGVL